MTMTLVFILLERESSCLQNAMILVIQNAMTLYSLQCLFGIPVSFGHQRVTAEALKFCNILPGFQKQLLVINFLSTLRFSETDIFCKKFKFQMPVSAVLK